MITLQLGAFSVVIETSFSGSTGLPCGAFLALMQPIHLAIGLVEGLITAAVLVFVYESRPELLRDVDTSDKAVSAKRSLKATIAILAVVVLVVGGGLMALGANIWNMAFYGCFVGYYLIWKPIVSAGAGNKAAQRLRIIIASVVGCVVTLQLGAFSVVLETSLSGITELPFGAFVALMQPIHLAIGLVEGLVTAAGRVCA